MANARKYFSLDTKLKELFDVDSFSGGKPIEVIGMDSILESIVKIQNILALKWFLIF